MAPSLSVPQDLVDEIISHLHDDIDALKKCTMVSHSFYLPSRKLLFSSIILNNPDSITGLYSLLIDAPDIANLIRDLHLQIFPELDDIDVILSEISRSIKQLQHLVLGHRDAYGVYWQDIPNNYRNALKTLVCLDSLRSLELACIYFIPLSFIHMAKGIKALTMEYIQTKDDLTATDIVPVMQLEELHLGSSVSFNQTSPLISPRLRQLSFVEKGGSSLESATQYINVTSCAIDNLVWRMYVGHNVESEEPVFKIPAGVRWLSFELLARRAVMADTWLSIHDMLKDTSVAGSLEKLTIVITSSYVMVSKKPSQLFSHSESWLALLDILLADTDHCPRLIAVEFLLERTAYDETITGDNLPSILGEMFPRLHSAGILKASTCLQFDWRILCLAKVGNILNEILRNSARSIESVEVEGVINNHVVILPQ